MMIGLDTDVVVHWAMDGASRHEEVRDWIRNEVSERRNRLALTQQVLREVVHVTTDPRRFEIPLSMKEALRMTLELWNGEEVVRVLPTVRVYDRTCELMERYRLGRKRILDTSLAATLEAADVTRLATLNPGDFTVFPFLELVGPGVEG